MTELWTTAQAAEHCGIKPGTFRDYRTTPSLGVPAPVSGQSGRGGQDLYDADEIRAWHANRPGRGARTDLEHSAESGYRDSVTARDIADDVARRRAVGLPPCVHVTIDNQAGRFTPNDPPSPYFPDDLAAWLLEKIAEDERFANALDPYGDGVSDIDSWHTRACGYRQGEWHEPCDCQVPARRLAECDAKRRIIDAVLHSYAGYMVLRLLALPYADRPGYRQEWRPEDAGTGSTSTEDANP